MRVCLVGLDTIRQSNCNELCIVSIRSNFRDCGLREKTGDKRVDATAYPKNESSAGSLAQITPQEIDATPNLKRRIEIGGDPECPRY